MNFAGQLFFSLFSDKKKEAIAERGERKLHRQSMQAIIDFIETFLGNVRDADVRRDQKFLTGISRSSDSLLSRRIESYREQRSSPKCQHQRIILLEQFYLNRELEIIKTTGDRLSRISWGLHRVQHRKVQWKMEIRDWVGVAEKTKDFSTNSDAGNSNMQRQTNCESLQLEAVFPQC